MDLWDMTKLLGRRWYVALPGLLLTAIAAVWTLTGVQPDWVCTSTVTLVPPISKPAEPGQPTLGERNPYIGYIGLPQLANGGLIPLQEPSTHDALKAAGLSDSFTITVVPNTAQVTLEVTAATKQQALDTTTELIARYSAAIKDTQTAAQVASQDDMVRVNRLGSGDAVPSSGKIKKAVIVVGALGLILTLAVTIMVDAIVRRSARRRAGLPSSAPTAPEPMLAAPARVATRVAPVSPPVVIMAPPAPVPAPPPPASVMPTSPIPVAPVSPVPAAPVPMPPGAATIRAGFPEPTLGILAGTGVVGYEEPPTTAIDSTVILPLTGGSPRRRGSHSDETTTP